MIRAKITPTIKEEGVHFLIEWVKIEEGERPGEVVAKEEFFVGNSKQGSSYFSKIGVHDCEQLGGTFFIDESGKRHFVALIDPAALGLTGSGL